MVWHYVLCCIPFVLANFLLIKCPKMIVKSTLTLPLILQRKNASFSCSKSPLESPTLHTGGSNSAVSHLRFSCKDSIFNFTDHYRVPCCWHKGSYIKGNTVYLFISIVTFGNRRSSCFVLLNEIYSFRIALLEKLPRTALLKNDVS